MQKFAGALAGQHATKGIFITTSSFTDEALRYASALAIEVVLLDGLGLANLMIEHDVGVTTESVYKIKHLCPAFQKALPGRTPCLDCHATSRLPFPAISEGFASDVASA